MPKGKEQGIIIEAHSGGPEGTHNAVRLSPNETKYHNLVWSEKQPSQQKLFAELFPQITDLKNARSSLNSLRKGYVKKMQVLGKTVVGFEADGKTTYAGSKVGEEAQTIQRFGGGILRGGGNKPGGGKKRTSEFGRPIYEMYPELGDYKFKGYNFERRRDLTDAEFDRAQKSLSQDLTLMTIARIKTRMHFNRGTQAKQLMATCGIDEENIDLYVKRVGEDKLPQYLSGLVRGKIDAARAGYPGVQILGQKDLKILLALRPLTKWSTDSIVKIFERNFEPKTGAAESVKRLANSLP